MMACGLGWRSDIFPPGAAAYCSEDVSLVQSMLIHDADVQAQNSEGETSLHLAVMCGRLRTAELLLQYGADVSVRDKYGCTPLMSVVFNADPSIALLLLKHGANPNAQDLSGDTVLHYSLCDYVSKNVIHELLAHGADPGIKNRNGDTPAYIGTEEETRRSRDIAAEHQKIMAEMPMLNPSTLFEG